jgi:hypothetical protein
VTHVLATVALKDAFGWRVLPFVARNMPELAIG